MSTRLQATARALYEAGGHSRSWDAAPTSTQDSYESRAAAVLAAADAADDRIRLTMPEFHAIKADAVADLSSALHRSWDAESRAAAEAAGVPEFIEQHRQDLADHYLEPVNHEAAMASLIRERTAAALRSTADHFDAASLEDITAGMELDASVPPRFKRIMIRGCAEWLRTRAGEMDEGTRTPYVRVNTCAVIDMDRHSALLDALHKVIDRSRRLARLAPGSRNVTPFIMTDHLVDAIESVGEE